MNKYVIWYYADCVVGYTNYVSLEIALEDAYLHAMDMIPNEIIHETELIIKSPFSYE